MCIKYTIKCATKWCYSIIQKQWILIYQHIFFDVFLKDYSWNVSNSEFQPTNIIYTNITTNKRIKTMMLVYANTVEGKCSFKYIILLWL